MEILYYWIKKELTYQNIGFRLSNRFVFKQSFHKNNFVIEVNETPNYQDDFYGKHIINISAIIGENGAGKTNLLYSLISRLTGYNYVYGMEFLLAFYDATKIIFYETLTSNGPYEKVEIKTKLDYEIIIVENEKQSLGYTYEEGLMPRGAGLIYYNPIYDFRDYPFQIETRDYSDVSSTFLLWKDNQDRNTGEYDMVAIHRSQEIQRQFEITQSTFLKKLKEFKEINIPETIEIEVLRTDRIEKTDLGISTLHLYELFRQYGSKTFQNHNDIIRKEARPSDSYSRNIKEKSKAWLLVNFIDHFFYCLAHVKDLDDKILNVVAEDFDFFKKNKNKISTGRYDSVDWPEMSIEEFRKIVLKFFDIQQYINKEDFNIYDNLRRILKIIDSSVVEEDNDAVFIFPFAAAQEFMSICDNYARCFKNEYRQSFIRVQWRNMSSGELGFLSLFSRINLGYSQLLNHYEERNRPLDKIYLFIDEGEHGFHPHWQKMYIKTLVDFLTAFKGVTFQVLITSHSPIMLSDIPKSNVTFLIREGSYTRNYDSNDMPETFGSNIHTLFRESFFVKDGLIGNFAQKKIEELINKVKEVSSNTKENEFDQILNEIELIGEPILRNKLKEMLMAHSSEALQIRFHENELQRLRSE